MSSTSTSDGDNHYAQMLASGQYSDLIVTCGGHTFNLHRVVVATRSDFFQAACGGDFKESHAASIDLPEDDACILARVICFIYLSTYSTAKLGKFGPQSALYTCIVDTYCDTEDGPFVWQTRCKLHALMYAAGLKFGVEGLSKVARRRFLIAWAEQDENNYEPQSGIGFKGDNEEMEVVKIVFESTPSTDRGLRDIITTAVLSEIERECVPARIVRKLLESTQEVAKDVAMRRMTKCK